VWQKTPIAKTKAALPLGQHRFDIKKMSEFSFEEKALTRVLVRKRGELTGALLANGFFGFFARNPAPACQQVLVTQESRQRHEVRSLSERRNAANTRILRLRVGFWRSERTQESGSGQRSHNVNLTHC
jgi:hypothetical protein